MKKHIDSVNINISYVYKPNRYLIDRSIFFLKKFRLTAKAIKF